MGIDIKNETHWRTRDIKRLVIKAAEASGTEDYWKTVNVTYSAGAHEWWNCHLRKSLIRIMLPKRGVSGSHPNPLVALAAAAIDSKTPILPVQQTYALANGLAWSMARLGGTDRVDGPLADAATSNMPPAWAPDIYIAKYADPLKDGTFVEFAAKKQKEIAKQQAIIDTWTERLNEAQEKIQVARAKQKKAKRSLANAKARRRR